MCVCGVFFSWYCSSEIALSKGASAAREAPDSALNADIHFDTEGQSRTRLSQSPEWDFHMLGKERLEEGGGTETVGEESEDEGK